MRAARGMGVLPFVFLGLAGVCAVIGLRTTVRTMGRVLNIHAHFTHGLACVADMARAKKPRPKMETEERTLEALERLPPLGRAIGVHVYLVAAYWSWWMVLFVPAFILWRFFPDVPAFFWATIVLGVLWFGGAVIKGVIERYAPRW